MLSSNKNNNLKLLIIVPLILGGFCVGINKTFAASIGERVTFKVDSNYDIANRERITANLRLISNYAYFYVEDNYWDSLKNTKKDLFLSAIEELATEFDTVIYPTERSVFGSEWNPGVDNDKRITILITPLVDNAGGYFNTFDGYPVLQAPRSNEREMVYLNTTVIQDPNAKAFLAHEFQHLITFYQKTVLYNLEDDVWLNEARSEYAPTLCGYNDTYTGSYLADKVGVFLDIPTDSLTEWHNNNVDYSAVNLFIHYLVGQFGKEILTKMILNNKVGIESINAALAESNHQETFSDVFSNWIIADNLNNCNLADGQYCYKNSQLTYERLHVDYSASYSGFPNLIVSRSSTVKDWSPRWYRFRQNTVVPTDRDTLKLEFKGLGDTADFHVPYIITDQNNQTTIQSIALIDKRGTIYVPNFTSLNKSVVIAPFNQYKKNGFNYNVDPMTTFTFTASSINEEHIAINSILPAYGSTNGGFNITINGAKLSSANKILFGQSTIINFNIVNDGTITFTAPAYESGKINVSLADSDGNTAMLINGFTYVGGNYPNGSLLRAKGDYKVYIINNGYKRWVQHSTIFNMYGHLRWENIIDVSLEELNQYQDAWLIRANGDKRVYEVDANGIKHWLNMTAEQFLVSGCKWDMVYAVNNFERDFYKTGVNLLFQ